MLSAPEPLDDRHRLDDFDCGEPNLDHWLLRRARANQAADASRTFVVAEGAAVVGYYCLAAGAVARDDAPRTLARNRPDPIPVMVLGRLAIHRHHQQRGIGTALLGDAIARTLKAADIAGMTALLLHAISEDARRFYLSRGFLASPVREMTLMLPLATARKVRGA